MKGFLDSVQKVEGNNEIPNAKEIAQSHIVAFASEQSRVTGKTIDIADYINQIND